MSTQTPIVIKSWNDLPKSDRNAIVVGVIVVAIIAVVVIHKKIKQSTVPVQIEAVKQPESPVKNKVADDDQVKVHNVAQIFITNMKFNERRN